MRTPIAPPEAQFCDAGLAVAQVSQVLAQLRGPGGCAWTAAQSCQNLAPYMIEEAHEAAQAAASEDMPALQEELGDVLMQVLYLSQVAQAAGHFGLKEVAQTLQHKLVRRSPHVFGDTCADDAAAVATQWEAIKAQERAERAARPGAPQAVAGRLAGLPATLPALLRAQRALEKTADLKAEPMGVPEAWAAMGEALAGDGALDGPLGQLLMAVVALCHRAQVNSEAALQAATSQFACRVAHVEAALGAKEGTASANPALDDLQALWDEAGKMQP